MTPRKEKIKCPNCGDSSQTEILHDWGSRIEIYCETCSLIAIIQNPNPPIIDDSEV